MAQFGMGQVMRRYFVLAVLVAACWTLSPSSGFGQSWVANKVDMPALVVTPETTFRNDRNLVMQGLREDAFPVALTEKNYKDYFWNYALPLFLQPAAKNNFPVLRKEFHQYTAMGKSGKVHTLLNELVIAWAKKVLGVRDLDLAYKYNAVLMVSELNLREADGIAKTPAVAYPGSLQVLSIILDQSKNMNLSDALQVAALIGYERLAESHATSPLQPDALKLITDQSLALLKLNKPPGNRDPAGHDWMRRSAAYALGALGNVGIDANARGNTDILAALDAVVSDPNGSLMIRCAAAKALGELKYQGAKVDFVKLLNGVGQVTVYASEHHLAKAKERQDYELRRNLKSCLHSIHLSLAGPDEKSGLTASLTGSPQQEAAKALAGRIEAVWKVFDNDKLDGADLASQVELRLADLRRALNMKPGPAKAGLATQPAAAPASAAPPPPNTTAPPAATAGR